MCGGLINGTAYGAINSPGYPGHYPPDRDCQWLVRAPLGKRIQFVFATLQMEHHENCSFDYLAVSPQVIIFTHQCGAAHGRGWIWIRSTTE